MGSNDKTADSPLVLGCGAVIALVVIVVCAGIIGPKGCGTSTPTERRPTTGEQAILVATKADAVFVARTSEDLGRLIDLARGNDSVGMSQMRLVGQVWMVPNGTKCKVIKSGFTVFEVRLMEGSYSGQSGFVVREVVKRR